MATTPPSAVTTRRSGSRTGEPRPSLVYAGVACCSAGVIILEVVLTRVFAVTQFYHFAFLTVSLALLGFGASGSALAAFPGLGKGGPRRWTQLAFAQALTTVAAYLAVNSLPFDSFSIAWDRRQIGYLVVYYLALAVPFFFGGAVIGVLLSGGGLPGGLPSRRVYGASLAGSGVGALVALGSLARLGGEGVVALAATVAAAGAFAFAASAGPRRRAGRVAAAGLTAVLAAAALAPPGLLDLRLSPYKDLQAALRYPDAHVVATRWSAAARVDHVRSAGIRSLPGLSFTYQGEAPTQDGVTFDGDDLSPIPRVAPDEAGFVPYMLGSLPFSLRPGGHALVLEPRGGLDVLVALGAGAGRVTAVEASEAAVDAALATGAGVYADDRVTVVLDEPRAFVERTSGRFAVIDLALTAPYRPVASGAYSLAEDYRLTAEAFDRYLARLERGGVLAVMRWVQTPPSEETRLVGLAVEAVERAGRPPAGAVVALRSYATVLVLVAPDGFTPADLAGIRAFAELRRFDLVALPGLTAGEANRFNVVPDDDYYRLAAALIEGDDRPAVYESVEFDIAPPTDDHPFFGHYFRWGQAGDVLAGLGRTWQPFGGAGYFVLLALLAISVAGAALLIVAPLLVARARRRGNGTPDRFIVWWTLGYFGLLGMGFLLVEIPLIQRYILLVGRPTVALAVVLFALLVATGAGSLASHRVPWRAGAAALVVGIVVYPWLIGRMTGLLLAAPAGVRIAAGAAALAPLGFGMGTMFPRGIAYLEGRAPALVPWAWGVNGTLSVISAAASALLALSFGFTLVVVLGAVCYAGAAVLARGPGSRAGSPFTRPSPSG